MLSRLRFPLKTASFVGWTGALYALLEAETALSPEVAHRRLLHLWQGRYGRGLLRIWGVRVSPGGPGLRTDVLYPAADARGVGRLFVMNHRSALDIFIALAFAEATIVSRADLAGWPVIGTAARRVGTLFVDRKSRSSGSAVVQAMANALGQGRGVLVFPEGTTFEGDEVRPFHVGGFAAAVRAGASVVPLGLTYERADTVFGEEEFSTHMKRVSGKRRIRAALQAGVPISAEGHTAESLRDAAHASLQELVLHARARIGGPL